MVWSRAPAQALDHQYDREPDQRERDSTTGASDRRGDGAGNAVQHAGTEQDENPKDDDFGQHEPLRRRLRGSAPLPARAQSGHSVS
jgi:hypothetical protein